MNEKKPIRLLDQEQLQENLRRELTDERSASPDSDRREDALRELAAGGFAMI